ncbi:MAG: class D sortase [Caldicoprobacterales bacterium]
MKRIGLILMIISAIIISYSGIKIYRASKSIESIGEEPNRINNTGTIEEQIIISDTKTTPKVEKTENNDVEINIEEEKVMSDELNRHQIGETVAKLKIPKIGRQYTVYWGTDDKTLDKGVGMYVSKWTVTPDFVGHVVMSGHRDTVFAELGMLEVGDILEIYYRGQVYQYKINDIWITTPDDRTVIVDKDESVLTLTTCYPFDYIGAAPKRYIVQSKKIGNTSNE